MVLGCRLYGYRCNNFSLCNIKNKIVMARQEDDKLYIKKNEVQKYCKKYGVLTQKELDDELWYSYGVLLIVEKD